MNSENRILPIFPLPLVQFPGTLTPLHIFEARYRKMLKDVMSSDKTFGITCRADEPGIGEGRPLLGSVGCTVEVALVQELEDGRSNLLCVGGTRYRLLEYQEGELYLQAEVEFFEDDAPFDDLSNEVREVKQLFERTLEVGKKLKDETGTPEQMPDLPDDGQALSFIVAAYLELELSEKQALLELTDTRERLTRISRTLRSLVENYERRAVMQKLTRSNGHGGKLPEF